MPQDPALFQHAYADVENANQEWNAIPVTGGSLYAWDDQSTYIQEPPFFQSMSLEVPPITPIVDAQVLAKVGDSVTTDHISPAGNIASDSPAGQYLRSHGIDVADFNSYGSRRGNDRVMTRGTFANIRLRNQLAPGTEGGVTKHFPSGEIVSIYEAAQRYHQAQTPTVVIAGADYGMGSSRDWAAKGTYLLGVRAVLARSFERIHRSNLIGMGVLPLQFTSGEDSTSLGLTGEERFSIRIDNALAPQQTIAVDLHGPGGAERKIHMLCRIDTPIELDYYRNGGILHMVLRRIAAANVTS